MRRKLLSKTSHKAGLPPGTLLHIGEQHASPVRLQLVDYSPDHLEERELNSAEECRPCRHSPTVSWINLDGVHRTELLEQMGAVFDLHPLVQENIVNTDHRPKLEEFDEYLFVVVKRLHYDARQTMIHTEQVSLVLGEGFVLSFQEQEGDVFEGVRKWLRNSKGRLRSMRVDQRFRLLRHLFPLGRPLANGRLLFLVLGHKMNDIRSCRMIRQRATR